LDRNGGSKVPEKMRIEFQPDTLGKTLGKLEKDIFSSKGKASQHSSLGFYLLGKKSKAQISYLLVSFS
jgi:hypothetical protein